MSKRLIIEWRRLDVDGRTCDRCRDSETALMAAVAELRGELEPLGVEIVVRETALAADDLDQSNLLLFNGRPMEELLDDARPVETDCPSCAGLIGSAACCRALEIKGRIFEAASVECVKTAALRALAMS